MEDHIKFHLNIWILWFEILSNTSYSASTSNSHYEDVDFSVSVFPYLRTSSLKMHLCPIY